ncbi:hypothetical protein TKK_0017422 [Trichogramma kaykai]|uniref:Pentacotripeptide-repeat region of PRORP domain-containing protein n=1 Tax=Trichogramma kaykai TaxID=54128 RepID=A0ABD2W340_9HYME
MAMCASALARSSVNLFTKNVFNQLVVQASRQLYTPNSMGINGYLNARDYVKSQFLNVEHLFFQKMKDFVNKEDGSMIFTEDLKTMLHIVEKKPEDLELMYNMIKKFNNQNNLRFGSFVFGTVAMRAFYHLDEPELALKAFKDPQLNNFFDQIMTHQLLMDLLYNHGKFSEVREVYDIIKTKNINGIVHPRNPFILVMAACYKENSKESYQYALKLLEEVQTRGFDLPRRSISFLAALALKQNDPSVALEVASIARNMRYIDIRCIKVLAYVGLKRTDEIMIHFRNTLQNDIPTRRKQMFFKDTIEEVEAYVERENLSEVSDLAKMLKEIKMHDYVQTGTLDEHICSPIEQMRSTEQKPWQQNNFNGQPRFQQNRFSVKPGLRDVM